MNQSLLNKRIELLGLIIFIVAFLFVGRLFYLQIIRHDHYVALADNEQLKRLKLPAKRGTIYVKDGSSVRPLVLNQPIYTVFADPKITKEDDKIISTVKDVAGGNAKKNLEDLLAKKDTRYQILATGLTRHQADLIKEKKLSGIGFQEGTQRVYPEGSLASQVLGFVDHSGEGRYGVEGKLNDRLKGEDGLLQSVTDVSSVPLTIGGKNINQPAKNGDNLVLTIDRNIQYQVEQTLLKYKEKFGADSLSAVVMNANTGAVLGMANLPDYKPAEFNKVTDISSFNNNVISLDYEPASTIKPFSLAAAIDTGAIKPTDTYVNTGSIQVEDRVINNAIKGHTGTLTFQQVLNLSLNTGTVTAFKRMGNGNNITKEARQTVYSYFHDRFGLGRKTGIELTGEVPGMVISPEEQEGNAVRYSNMSFGHGMYPTMIQVASGYSSLVNGGKYYQPTVVAGVVNKDGKFVQDKAKEGEQVIKESTSATMQEMTNQSLNSYTYSTHKKGYNIGGKTGTAEVIRNGAYTKDETIASFLGHGGDNDQKYVIMVRVSKKGSKMEGPTHGMPIFNEISNWMIDYLGIKTKG